MKAQMDPPPLVLATGGLAPLMANVATSIDHVESDLTLEGLRLISQEME
jgi:type III pantothenate kinase